MQRFEQVTVRKLKFDGSVKYAWPGDLLEELDGWAVVRHDPKRHHKVGDDTRGSDGSELIHYLGLNGPLTVLFAFDAGGTFLDAKCDAALPAVQHGDRIDFVDLDLDVIVLPGGSHYVRDQEVFAERALSMRYTGEAKRQAHLGILHALRMVRRGLFPFDGHAGRVVRELLRP